MYWKKRALQLEREKEYFKKRVEELTFTIADLRREVETLREYKEELDKIKPVIETSGFRPAMCDKCDNCKFAYFSDYDDSLIGCCKDVVCNDFVPYKREKEDER